MILLNGKQLNLGHFPDNTLLLKESIPYDFENYREATITWLFNYNEELVALIYLTKHLRSHGVGDIYLKMPYIPNARQDRVKSDEDVFTLKHFADVINWLDFASVEVLDPHSYVSEALFNNLIVTSPRPMIEFIIEAAKQHTNDVSLFFPDEGSMKRYSGMFDMPYTFGMKKRDWKTGNILGLDIVGDNDLIKGKTIIIIDDICSRGGTFYHSAKKLKELGADKIYLWVSHCENSILEGELLRSKLIDKIYTTNSIFTKQHEGISVMKIW